MKIFQKCISLPFFLLCFSVLSFSSYAAAPAYKFVDLGLQESDSSQALAVNDNGQVAGTYWLFGKKHYFLWNEREGITLINLPETTTSVFLNNAGQIAGNYKDVAGSDKGFFWDPCCGICDIGSLGGSFTHVYDMNDRGQIVGESGSKNPSLVNGQDERHAFLWQCCTMSDLGALIGDLGLSGDRSQATGINNQGQIIGTANFLIAHKGKFLRSNDRAVIWQNGFIEEIDPTYDGQSEGLSINDNGAFIWKKQDYRGCQHYLSDFSGKLNVPLKSQDNYFAKINNSNNILYFPANILNSLLYSSRLANELLFTE